MTVLEIIGNQQIRLEIMGEQLKRTEDANKALGESNADFGRKLAAHQNAALKLPEDVLKVYNESVDDELNPIQPAPGDTPADPPLTPEQIKAAAKIDLDQVKV